MGLEDVSKYPDLIAELLRRQWTEAEVRGALAKNLLRVFEEVEKVRTGWPPMSFLTLPACLCQSTQPSLPRSATTAAKLQRRRPSRWTSWVAPVGLSTATQRPPASTASQGPCWPSWYLCSSACGLCDLQVSWGPRKRGWPKGTRPNLSCELLGLLGDSPVGTQWTQ